MTATLTQTHPMVELSGVTKSFGPIRAVRGIDLAIRPGEVVALLGPNGAGKSTTIDMLLGLTRPDGGQVSLFGQTPAEAIAAGTVGAMLQTGGLIRHPRGRSRRPGRLGRLAALRPRSEPCPRRGHGQPRRRGHHDQRRAAAVTIRLLLADDQELVRTALATLLQLEHDFEVVAQVGRGDEVVAAAQATKPDIALLDIEMPSLDGIAAAAALGRELPACKVVILTTFGRPGYLRRAMESGALGFVVKDAPAEELADAIRRVAAGERVVDPQLATLTLAGGPSPLTARERDVLVAARSGATVAEIAASLVLSEGTVRNYLSAAITKTGARNRIEATRLADERGWL